MQGIEQQIFLNVVRMLDGASTQAVGNVALNLLVNAIRQASVTRKEAEATIDFLFARGKTILLENYDSVTGRRRVMFPVNHVVEVPFVKKASNGGP